MKSFICLAFTVLLTVLLLQSVHSEKKLIFVQELFRHGARYPLFSNKGDMSDYTFKDHSNGELTVNGKNMHYLLGKRIYQEYWNKLFAGTQFENQYNSTKFYIKSTDVNRTLESAQSHIMGIFDSLPKLEIYSNQTQFSSPLWPGVRATAGDVFPTATGFHPVPIHTQKFGTTYNNMGDFLRTYDPHSCPNQNVWKSQNQQTQFVQQVYNYPNFTKALQELSKQANQTNITFEAAGEYFDTYECNLFLGKPNLPVFNDPKYARDLQYISVLDLYFNLFYADEQIRTTASGFFEATVNNINHAINKKQVQWVIYSAHDTTVANMLAAMNLTNAACIYEAYLKGDTYNSQTCINKYPGYSASLIFEVYQDNVTTINTFKVRYSGEYRKIPFCDYQEECPVSVMQSWFQNYLKVDNIAAGCGLFNEDKQFYKGFAIIEFGVILGFLIYWVMKHLKRAKHDITKPETDSNVKQIKKALVEEEIEGPYK